MDTDDIEISISSEYKMSHAKTFKFLVLGDTLTGKTHFLEILTDELKRKKNPKKIKKTIGCELHVKYLQDPFPEDNAKAMAVVEFWDITGDIHYLPYIKVYTQNQLHDFCGIIFMFDMSNLKTLFNLKKHLKNIFENYFTESGQRKYLKIKKDFSIPLLIIGNKLNLLNETDKFEKVNQVNKYIQEIFAEKPDANINIIYLSDKTMKEGSNEFEKINKFIDAAVRQDHENQFLIDSTIDFESNSQYQYYTRKTLADINDKVRRAARGIGALFVSIGSIFTFFVPPKRFEV